ncbi:MAG: oligosaccharide flippase family protein [Nonlabens ulvanivorans]|uniref:O-antigen/teichoic acid export membrane protein n=5 Tax=Nonlabens ulvanivorans TaxID=906888 RepID=A0A084JTL8_NONUL|nr:oligosaccharide flippase family protein [Nonlabens ulvanivorans]KEZ92302.1 sugar isomerase [Nonlabens ulvanivorans]PRX15135.1 O-antigen/teichoic acid export membrane protein [Nonlabens ulvanivorans]
MQFITSLTRKKISPEQLFMLSVLVVNGGNYIYNLVLGRLLGPAQFADAAILITFLLVLSFLAMTFQLVTAKYAVLLENTQLPSFLKSILKSSLLVGIIAGLMLILFSGQLQEIFHTTSKNMFVIFGVAVPFYFLMSVNRGFLQGKNDFKGLALTYQSEMLVRLGLTLLLLFVLKIDPILIVAIGILVSLILGLFPFKMSSIIQLPSGNIDNHLSKQIKRFFLVTLFYELTQIIINNSDILLVKHYFEDTEAGLYASLALIGRVVYFMAWMFVMLLLPKVITLQKEGKETQSLLFKYVGYITLLCAFIIAGTALFPELVVEILFGNAYTDIAPLLWKYAIATSLFAIANIFSYYFLSLGKYKPVIISGVMGLAQVVLIIFYHKNLEQVVLVQILAMTILMIMQVVYFIASKKS